MALAAGGGKPAPVINVTMNVQTKDAESFKSPHNRHAILGDLARELRKAHERG